MAMGAAKKPNWDAIAHTKFGPQLTKQSQEGLYHPLVSVVQASLAQLATAADTESVLSTRLNWVKYRKTLAEAALTKVGVDPGLPSKIAQTFVAKPSASGDPRFQWPLTGDFRVTRLWFRLLAGDKYGAPTDGGEFVNTNSAYAALTDNSVVSDASQTPAASARLLLEMRCLLEVYARWEMAARVADALFPDQFPQAALTKNQLMARVLAYARIEGDLAIPPEDDTLQGTDPGATKGIRLPPGRSRFTFNLVPARAYLYCVTYLAVAEDFPDNPPFLPYLPPKFLTKWDLSNSLTMATVADFALTVVLGGLDILWLADFQRLAEQLAPGSGQFDVTDQFDWPALNRGLAGGMTHEQGRAAAQQDYEARMDLLTMPARAVVTGPPDVTRTTARASSEYFGDYSGAGVNYEAYSRASL
jgi:hypothetical protein